MATHGKDDAVEGSWSPKQTRTAAEQREADRPAADKSPDELASDIEKTREELAETLGEIADKVSPKKVAKRTQDKVTADVKEKAHQAEDAVRTGAAAAVEAVKEKVDAVKDKVQGSDDAPTVGGASSMKLGKPVEGQPTRSVSSAPDPVGTAPSPLSQDTVSIGATPTPASSVTPYRSTATSSSSEKVPVYAGAAGAVAALVLLLRRRRRRKRLLRG